MSQVILIIHLLLAIAMIGVVLLQRSEGGGLGIGGGGGGGGGMAGFLTGRSTKTLLTRTTAILAASFMATSLLLTWIESQTDRGQSITDDLSIMTPAEPSAPEGPSVPVE